ncbi:MAG: hypothetical protein KDA92_01725 [Planctomycetales bacterium]|nr:hypothetical protein [Planctomycetales bacterium]
MSPHDRDGYWSRAMMESVGKLANGWRQSIRLIAMRLAAVFCRVWLQVGDDSEVARRLKAAIGARWPAGAPAKMSASDFLLGRGVHQIPGAPCWILAGRPPALADSSS